MNLDLTKYFGIIVLLVLLFCGYLRISFSGSIYYDSTGNVLIVVGYKDEIAKTPWNFEDLYSYDVSKGWGIIEKEYHPESGSSVYIIKSHVRVEGGRYEVKIYNPNSYDLNDYQVRLEVVRRFGKYLKLDGDDYIESRDLRPQYFTVCLWFKIYQFYTNNQMLVDKFDYGNYGFGLWVTPGDCRGLSYHLVTDSGSYGETICNLIEENDWYFVCYSYDGSNIKLYLNGKLIRSVPASGNILYDSQPIIFGMEYWYYTGTYGNGLNGELDEIILYDRALSDEEVLRCYLGLCPLSGMLLYYDFDWGTATDKSGNGNHGIIHGAVVSDGGVKGIIGYGNFTIYNPSTGRFLNYCFEQINGECSIFYSPYVWVKVDSLPASSNTTLYLMPWTSNNATIGDNVFDFYDDFKVKDTTKWNWPTDWLIENGKAKQNYSSDWPPSGALSTINFNDVNLSEQGVIIETYAKNLGTASAYDMQIRVNIGGTWYAAPSVAVGPYDYWFGSSPEDWGEPDERNWCFYQVILKNGYQAFYMGYAFHNLSLIRTNSTTFTNPILQEIGINSKGQSYWEWIRVRKYADQEPQILEVKSLTEDSPNFKETRNNIMVFINKTFIMMPDSFIQFGGLDANGYGINGPIIFPGRWYDVPWRANEPADWTSFQIRGKARIYGSIIKVDWGGFSVTDDADVEIRDTIIVGYTRFASSNLKLIRVKMRFPYRDAFPEFVKKPTLLKSIEVENYNYYLSFYQQTGHIIVYGLKIENCRNGISLPERANQEQTILDMQPFYDPTKLEALRGWNMNNSVIYYNFTIKISVTDDRGQPLSNADVTIYDKNGNIVYHGYTDANGKINLTLTAYKAVVSTVQLSDADVSYVPSVSEGWDTTYYWNVYVYNPFRITVRKSGYTDFESLFNITKPFELFVTLKPSTAASGLEIRFTALAYEKGENATVIATTTYNGILADVDYVLVRLLDSYGVIIMDWQNMTRIAEGIYTYTFDTSSLKPGVYIVQFRAYVGTNITESCDLIKIENRTAIILSKIGELQSYLEKTLDVKISTYKFYYPNQTLQVISKVIYNKSLVNPDSAWMEIYYPNNTLLANITSFTTLRTGIILFSYNFSENIESGLYKIIVYAKYNGVSGLDIEEIKIGRGIYDLRVIPLINPIFANQTEKIRIFIINRGDTGQDAILKYYFAENPSDYVEEVIYTPPLQEIYVDREIKVPGKKGNYTLVVELSTIDKTYSVKTEVPIFVIYPPCYEYLINETGLTYNDLVSKPTYLLTDRITINYTVLSEITLPEVYLSAYAKYPDYFINYISCVESNKTYSVSLKKKLYLNNTILKIENISVICGINPCIFGENSKVYIENSMVYGNYLNTLVMSANLTINTSKLIKFFKVVENSESVIVKNSSITNSYYLLYYSGVSGKNVKVVLDDVKLSSVSNYLYIYSVSNSEFNILNLPYNETKIYIDNTQQGIKVTFNYTVFIKYVDSNFNPIKNATITIYDNNSNVLASERTDENGIALFNIPVIEVNNSGVFDRNTLKVQIENPYVNTYSLYYWNVYDQIKVIVDPALKFGLGLVRVRKIVEETGVKGVYRIHLEVRCEYGGIHSPFEIYDVLPGNVTILSLWTDPEYALDNYTIKTTEDNKTLLIITLKEIAPGGVVEVFYNVTNVDVPELYTIGVDPHYVSKESEKVLKTAEVKKVKISFDVKFEEENLTNKVLILIGIIIFAVVIGNIIYYFI